MTGCTDRPDSEYYTFSQGGFAPCNPIDFTVKQEIKFKLNCMNYAPDDDSVKGTFTKLKAEVGYPYRDVIEPAKFNQEDLVSESISTDGVSGILTKTELTVRLRLRDMKYLSHYT